MKKLGNQIMNLSLPTSGRMTADQVRRYRALLAFQLRAAAMEHDSIKQVLNLPKAEHAKRLIKFGRRLIQDCIIGTVPD